MQATVEKHLNTLTPKPAIAWPNVKFTPTIGTPYLEPKLRPMMTTDGSLNRTGVVKEDALYILDVYVPIDTGTKVLRDWLIALEAHFPRNLILVNGSEQIRVRSIERNTPSTAGAWAVQGLNIKLYTLKK